MLSRPGPFPTSTAATLSLPFPASPHRKRRRSITLTVELEEEAVERVLAELTAVARARDPQAIAVIETREVPWTELSFVAVDVETTGFHAGRDRVIEVAWIRFDRGREVERFSSLLCVDVDVPAVVRRLTGIHAAMLADKPRFIDVAPGLVEALASADFAVAYNAHFDRGFLAAELTRVQLELPELPWVDPLSFLRDIESRDLPKRLVDAARRFGVPLSAAHRAESDARATGELLLRLAPRIPARTLSELVDKQERWSRARPPARDAAPSVEGIGARLLSLFR